MFISSRWPLFLNSGLTIAILNSSGKKLLLIQSLKNFARNGAIILEESLRIAVGISEIPGEDLLLILSNSFSIILLVVD